MTEPTAAATRAVTAMAFHLLEAMGDIDRHKQLEEYEQAGERLTGLITELARIIDKETGLPVFIEALEKIVKVIGKPWPKPSPRST